MEKADAQHIEKILRELNRFNSSPDFGTSRILFTPEELAGRRYIKSVMEKIGLEVTEDAIGNIFASLPGIEPELAPVWSGSHIDTVPNAGMFDGMAGVAAAIEALRLIKQSGLPHKRTVSAVVYTSEEPTRFGLSCLGSRALCGALSLADTERLVDRDGKSLAEVLTDLGYDKDKFPLIRKHKGDVFGAVELHIEQGSRLDKDGKKIGIVKSICAPANYLIHIEGVQSHAGGASMTERTDALAAAAKIVLAAERLAMEDKCGEYTTATVGKLEVIPNAMNVIPGEVTLTLDIRYTNPESESVILHGLEALFEELITERGVKITVKRLNRDKPVCCDERFMDILKRQCVCEGASFDLIISGAYHDSLMVGQFAPVAMLFVPSKNGISHSPMEWTDFADIALGTDVLAGAILDIANM